MTKKLIAGFREFKKETYENGSGLMPRLVKDGQSPDYFIISCIDSRSNPGTIFRPDPGTFFAHKAMGAIVRPYKKGTALAAALQFALIHNKVRELIILGHTGCGAIKALIERINDDEITSFIDVAQQGLQHAQNRCANVCTHDELTRYAEEEIVLESTRNLKTYPSVVKALETGQVTIRPWLFDMESGELLEYCEDQKKFCPITDH
ncbi:MAG: carbonic anhydrase [Pseudobdellovibrionaceae bacterium]|jgi:carbonic anhydrase|nr:carbonic anhydrase [Pseudobdellovibrionaceae bacterium]